MSADDVKPTRLGAAQEAIRRFLHGLPAKYRVGLVIFSSEPYVAAPLTHDRQLVLEGLLLGDASFGQGTAIGDALARSVELLQPRRSARPNGTPVSRRRRSGRPPPPSARPGPAALGDPAALGRRPDARHAGSARRCGTREVVRHPRLHGRARHAGRRAQPRRVLAARAARSRDVAADRAGDRRRVLRDPAQRRASTPSTRTSPRGSGSNEGVARAELRAGRARRAVRARRRRALSLLWVQRLP